MSRSSRNVRSDRIDRLQARIRGLEQRLRLTRLHGTVATAANEAETVEEALRIGVGEICRVTEWPVGHAFLRDASGMFCPTGAWYGADPERFPVLRRVSREARFAPGEGLIGRVGAKGQPEWIRNLASDPTFLRSRDALIEVQAALAIPLSRGRDVLGVVEFFSEAPRVPDPELLDILPDVGRQLAVVVERTRAERDLQISQRKFSGIVSISADAIICVDEDLRIIDFNDGASEIFGYACHEVLGRPLDVLIPRRMRKAHREHVRAFGSGNVAARRMAERSEVHGVRKSGEEFPAEASISKLEVDGERLYSVVLRDISGRIEYEEALRRYAWKLRRSNEELERFAFVASHDLQEPLRKIRSFTDRLVEFYEEELDDRGRDYLRRVQGASERMATLIRDLLSLSRVTTRDEPFQSVELEEVVRGVLSDLERQVAETGAEVIVGELPVLHGDPTHLRQLFQNLIGNALKYHREGIVPRVEVGGRVVRRRDDDRASKGKGEVEVWVRDNGIGFEAEDAERIFGVFERLHGRSAYDGTGVGLAICRKIVERHGGVLQAEGEPGTGATFVATFPLRDPSRGVGAAPDGEAG